MLLSCRKRCERCERNTRSVDFIVVLDVSDVLQAELEQMRKRLSDAEIKSARVVHDVRLVHVALIPNFYLTRS